MADEGNQEVAQKLAKAEKELSDLQSAVEEGRRQISELQAEKDEAEAQLTQLMAEPLTQEDIGGEIENLRGQVSSLQEESKTLRERLNVSDRRAARLEILAEHPELRGSEDLITEGSPEEMKAQAEKLSRFAAAQIEASRRGIERELAEKFGPPLGSSTEVKREPEADKRLREARDAGDATSVAEQIVGENLDKLLG